MTAHILRNATSRSPQPQPVRWHVGVIAFLLACLTPLACDSTVEPPPDVSREGRGATLSITQLDSRSLEEVRAGIEDLGIPVSVRYGVTAYKILYETIGIDGNPTTASGALVMPDPPLGQLDVVSYQHGTILKDDNAPSQGGYFIGVLYAGDGYMAVLPDLLGLGESPGVHPYHHTASTATAVVDMLRASYDFAATEDIALSGQLFLTGYSQGGHTVMAAHRAIQEEYSDEFTVTASTPMAGAYDLSGVMVDVMLGDEPYPSPFYMPYLILGYNEVYGLFDDPSEFLASPYDEQIPPLFDGTHSPEEINALMPNVVREALNPTLLAAFETDPNHPYRQVLAENDVYRWAPEAPIRLYHCSGDRHVPIANAYAALEGLTGSVELIEPVPGADHGQCASVALYAGKAWIDTF